MLYQTVIVLTTMNGFVNQVIAWHRKPCNRYTQPLQSECARVIITDGPFAETKEQLAGFYLIEARHLDEAIQLAVQIPPAQVGSIEVRPIHQFEKR